MDDLNQNQKQPVAWLAVLGGIAIALAFGIVVVPVAMMGGGFLADKAKSIGDPAIAAGTILSLVIAALIYWGVWLMSRRHSGDLAIGVIIGGALMVLLSGGCGLLLSGVAVGGVH